MSYARVAILGLILLASSTTLGDERESLALFENEIRPLLISRCVKCHGAKKSESDLRLDTREGLLKGGVSGPAATPKDPSSSLLIQALRGVDDVAKMPPDTRLSDRQIDALTRWIELGAPWPQGVSLGDSSSSLRSGAITQRERSFWSFQPLTDPQPPPLSPGESEHPIDRFISPPAQNAGLRFAAPADRRTLLRRATFDLTGLPPTQEEVHQFLADDSEDAFTTVIRRLLSRPSYGERWGRHWLDVVRYADTAGETADYPVPLAYKYRNWVIRAFNDDMPYDQFVREQIAGDILANDLVAMRSGADGDIPRDALQQYEELMIATGFIAISRRFGFDVENYHHLTIQDTIDTIGQSMLGLSLGCARCHDHKYDPINIDDYYAWYGIFESTRYSFPGSEEKKRPYDLFPTVPPALAASRKAEYDSQVTAIDAKLKALHAKIESLEERLGGLDWLSVLENHCLKTAASDQDGHRGFHVWRNDPLPMVGINTTDKLLKVPGDAPPKTIVAHPNPKDGVGIAWRSPISGRIRIRGSAHDAHACGDSVRWRLDAFGRQGIVALATGDAQKENERQFTLRNEELETTVSVGDLVQLTLSPKTHYGCDLTRVEFQIDEVEGEQRTWNVATDVGDDLLESNPNDDRFGNPQVWYFLQTPVQLEKLASNPKPLSARESERLRGKLASLRMEHASLMKRLAQQKREPPYEQVYGVKEAAKPADARIRIRGERRDLGAITPRRNLDILGRQLLPEGAGSGRREMADWLTRDNPLMARVMVNRIWQHHFGRGIVSTENDFGARGARPTHPQLLDWLASRFRDSGYSIKAMHRLIMSSAAYQRSGKFNQAAYDADPDARLLWRFNRRRLSAEEIRDAMLFVSGNLDRSIGTAHPFPDVETWGFTQHAPFYGDYRTAQRSVYLMQQRLKRHPFLALFDGADTNVSTARRELTTAPTQALYLMNSEFVHQQAKSLVESVSSVQQSRTATIHQLWRKTLGRSASTSEQESAVAFLKRYQTLAGNSNSSQDSAWHALARTLLTRNEFLFVD